MRNKITTFIDFIGKFLIINVTQLMTAKWFDADVTVL